MNTLRTLTVLSATFVTAVVLAIPAGATESPTEKSQIFVRSPHSIVGAFILLAFVAMVLFAVVNAVQQLRGKRGQADGKFRWR